MTVNKIKEFQSYEPCLTNLIEQLGGDFDHDVEFEVSSLVGGKNSVNDIIWLLGEMNDKPRLVRLAVYCAELVLHECGESNKHVKYIPSKSIGLAKKWLIDQSEPNATRAMFAASSMSYNTRTYSGVNRISRAVAYAAGVQYPKLCATSVILIVNFAVENGFKSEVENKLKELTNNENEFK